MDQATKADVLYFEDALPDARKQCLDAFKRALLDPDLDDQQAVEQFRNDPAYLPCRERPAVLEIIRRHNEHGLVGLDGQDIHMADGTGLVHDGDPAHYYAQRMVRNSWAQGRDLTPTQLDLDLRGFFLNQLGIMIPDGSRMVAELDDQAAEGEETLRSVTDRGDVG